MAASLRYDDGKTLKGIGTLASKSRLTGLKGSLLECLSNRCGNNSKGRQEWTLASRVGWSEVKKVKGDFLEATTRSFHSSWISTCNDLNPSQLDG